jgi:hypothetical protein
MRQAGDSIKIKFSTRVSTKKGALDQLLHLLLAFPVLKRYQQEAVVAEAAETRHVCKFATLCDRQNTKLPKKGCK